MNFWNNNLKFRPVSEYQDVEDLQHKREAIWYRHDQDNEMGLNVE